MSFLLNNWLTSGCVPPIGTQETMLSTDGLMVYAINWLFAALKASKRRFAIKCSAAQIGHNGIKDVLANHHSSSLSSSPANTSTSLSSPVCSKISAKLLKTNTILSQLREISCISAKRAAHCLDIITANYNQTQHQHNHNHNTSDTNSSSLLFTLHVYQYQIIANTNGKNTEKFINLFLRQNTGHRIDSKLIPVSAHVCYACCADGLRSFAPDV
ncbi:unnamed protein product [Medioppia subpectinata]|uniref:Uncharacterized protein n=1 Tax=Medioppia subpectinata TaxID=1979941 RepID=A0A7R9KHH4_9ACAR|nr:unnamed protein product [Medioppia subpectinata]CAG2103366.1 unnamed protein product [Medioppia subpectinata]